MLLNHKADKIMGKWENVRVEGTQLLADAVFDETDEEALKMFSKVEQGMLNCVSIGFDIEEVQYGMAGFEDTPIVIKCSLKEASLTPIPSNESALRLYDKEGTLLTSEKVTTLLSKINPIDNNMKKIQFFAAALMTAGFKLTAEPTEDDVLKETQKLANEHVALTAKVEALEADKTKLSGELTALKDKEKADEEAQITTLVADGVKAGKYAQDKVELYTKLAKADFKTTKEMIDSMPARTSLTAAIEGAKGTGANTETYAGWGLKRLHKEAPSELQRIKAEEPTRYQQLVKENA